MKPPMVGINTRGEVCVCMVVGCARKAIYRNVFSNRAQGTQRGYCSIHKHLAVNTPNDKDADFYGREVERQTHHD